MWLSHLDFRRIVNQAWNTVYLGNASQQVNTCCQTFQHLHKKWSREVFGNLFHIINYIQDELRVIQDQLATKPIDPYLMNKDLSINKSFQQLLEQEEVFYAQKTRTNWLNLGDKNTKYFHTQALIRRKINQILKLKDCSGIWVEEESLNQLLVDAFKKRFTASNVPSLRAIKNYTEIIQPCISAFDNDRLLAPVSKAELFEAVKSIDVLKAPGPDGVHAIFYQKFWDHIKHLLKSLVMIFLITTCL